MSEAGIESENPNIKPEFDGGSFTITHLSTSPEGFEFKTSQSIRRRQKSSQNLLNDNQRSRLQSAMKREMKFQGVEGLRDAKDALERARANESTSEIARLQLEYDETRRKYIKGMAGKVGIRNIRQEGNTLIADVKLVSFPVYNEFANPNNTPELLDLSSNAATAMIVRSSDGRIIIQHRAVERQRLDREGLTRGNASYTDIPGASAAGMIDAIINAENSTKGTPDAIDTNTLRANILKETGEELGLEDNDLKKIRIVGLAKDNVKIHDEILLLADSGLTASEIRERSRTSNRNKNLGDADFEEKFVDIDGTPQAIEKLLTDVHCPFPPTHAAVLIAAVYSLILEAQGLEAANIWKIQLEKDVQENYRKMNEIVSSYYIKYQEIFNQVPERYWGKNVPARNTDGYAPAYTPEEQGLPSFEDEMVRVGLIPETRRLINTAYLFDVDGVLTDPAEKQVTESALYERIIEKLQNGEVVGLNTGRSTAWMIERIIEPLQAMINDKSLLVNFVAIGEKGGTWITFDSEGSVHHGRVNSLSVPIEFHYKVKNLIEDKYSDCMFFDDTKETMVSIEMKDGYDLVEFHRRQKELRVDLAKILTESGLENKYKIDPTTIATDIESPNVGKALGANRFLEFLDDQDIKPKHFVAFGDSRSDFEMADELERKNKPITFVYAGDKASLGILKKDYPIEYLEGYSQGTLAYLSR